MHILLLRTWSSNIGNAVIEKGAKAALESTFPKAEITEVSAYPNYIGSTIESSKINKSDISNEAKYRVSKNESLSRLIKPIYKTLKGKSDNLLKGPSHWENGNQNLRNIAEFIDPDLVVLPGCVLGGGLAVCKPTLQEFTNRDIPFILLGVGGGSYHEENVEYIREILNEIKPIGFFSRDMRAYELYSELAEYSYPGIDCGLFINDWYSPPPANQEFLAMAFDRTPAPEISSDKKIVRLNHAPYRSPRIGYSNRFSSLFKSKYGEPIKPEFFGSEYPIISDNVRDYLFVYANAETTYADRIHSCIPSITYGNKAKYLHETPRAKLFENLLEKGVITEKQNGMLSANTKVLKSEKESQNRKLKKIVNQEINV